MKQADGPIKRRLSSGSQYGGLEPQSSGLNILYTYALDLVSAGDPIEVGAATSVLQPPKGSGQSHHLLLSAFKSEGGHAEPAAAVMGLLRLAAQVGE